MRLRVHGSTIRGFAKACENANIVAGSKCQQLTQGIDVAGWYSFDRMRELEREVLESYQSVSPIMERVGMEMMSSWYHRGPGKKLIVGGVDFLRYQTGEQGFANVIRGPSHLVGSFSIVKLDHRARYAVIRSTTPFNKDLERGVIIGGMMAPGDLDLVDVRNDGDEELFVIQF